MVKRIEKIGMKLLPVACCLLPTLAKRLFQQALISCDRVFAALGEI